MHHTWLLLLIAGEHSKIKTKKAKNCGGEQEPCTEVPFENMHTLSAGTMKQVLGHSIPISE